MNTITNNQRNMIFIRNNIIIFSYFAKKLDISTILIQK